MQADKQRYTNLFHKMLEKGVYFPPSAYESLFTSGVHDQKCLSETLDAFEESLK